jgi:HlyD family secretion protein
MDGLCGGRAERRSVDVIRRSGRLAAITSGLERGDKIIVYPSDKIAPNVRVQER